MNVYRIEILPKSAGGDARLTEKLIALGLTGVRSATPSRLFFLDGGLSRSDAERIASGLLIDRVTETARIATPQESPAAAGERAAVEILPRPGVMDPVAETTLSELRGAGYAVEHVRTGRRIAIEGDVSADRLAAVCRKFFASDVIEELVSGTAGVRPAPRPPVYEFKLRHAPIRNLDDAGLDQLSRSGHLFLTREEMRAIQAHYRELGREPTDLELETLAQTWSEHCIHKTLKSAVIYRGAPMPGPTGDEVELRYGNLLKDTIARATAELMAEGRGPKCLSVFKDNAGVIAFDDEFGVAFKVETHNRPSAIEPYGGAATGAGGCIRDVLGCGLGARPIANTDVFCVAPTDWPMGEVPQGVLHPSIVLRGVIDGVGDYGNRMGIPTVNGAIHFDPRYLGNPLVFCGCVGLIRRDRIEKAARPGDRIVVIGGRTGRDGIHGATFSSAELTDSHADEFSHAVQIGNAITEKRVLDAVMRANYVEGNPAGPRCLFTAITDCGAGGLSSAIGEMGAEIGAVVDLENVPLKYAGLRYDEIWISEAQERMVLAVPPGDLDAFMTIMREEEVEASVIGSFGNAPAGAPRLLVRFAGAVVGDMDMHFLHDGVPKRERPATWTASSRGAERPLSTIAEKGRLLAALRSPNISSREWVFRRYDHEVQGGSVIKPACGPGKGPTDAAVLRPRLDSYRGVAIGCGLAPELSDVDPYWMAMAAIDEALANVLCVGGDPLRTAMLDNFCWGRCDDPRQMGALVRACQACYDASKAWGVPFISGKDSLNNEFALDPGDVDGLLRNVRRYLQDSAGPSAPTVESVAQRVRETGRLSIPATLLISAVSLIDDVRSCITSDLKTDGGSVLLVGPRGLPVNAADPTFSLADANAVRIALAEAIRAGQIASCHDCGDGWLVAVAEMAIAGQRGVVIDSSPGEPFSPRRATFIVETRDAEALSASLRTRGVDIARVGQTGPTGADAAIAFPTGDRALISELAAAWRDSPRA